MDFQQERAIASRNLEAFLPNLHLVRRHRFAVAKTNQISFLGVNPSGPDAFQKVENHLHALAAMLTVDNPKNVALRQKYLKRSRLVSARVEHPIPANIVAARI